VEVNVEGGALTSPDLEIAGATVRGRVTATDDLMGPTPNLALSLSGDLRAPRLPGEDDINALIGENLPWTLEGGLDPMAGRLDLSRLELTAMAARLTATGPLDLSTGAGTLASEATVPELSLLQPLTSVRLGGRLELSGPVILADLGSRIDADLKGRWTQPSSDVALVGLAAGSGADLATRLSFADGTLRLTDTSARSPRSQINLALTLTPEAQLRDARYQVVLPDAAFLSGELGAELSGAARVEGTATGPFDNLNLDGSLTLARMQTAGQQFEEIAGRYRLRLQGGDIDGPVSLALRSPFGPAEAKAELSLRSDALSLTELEASLPETSITGELRLPLNGAAPRARVQGRFAALSPWLQFAGLDGKGSGTMTLQMNEPGQSDPILLDADLAEVSLVTAPGAAPVTAAALSLRLKADDLALETPARFTVQGRNLARDQLNLAQLDLEGEGTADDLALSLVAQGHWIDPFELRAKGGLQRNGEQLAVLLSEAEGKAFGQPLKLRQAARLTLGPQGSRVDGLDVVSGNTELTATAELGGEQIQVTARLDRLPMKTVNAFWDSGITGMISADLTVSGSLAAPLGEARLTATGLRPKGAKDLPELELKATADWRDGRAQVAGNLGGPQVTAADFSLEGPLTLGADGSLDLPEDGAVAGRVDWAGKLTTLTVFVPLPQHRISGDGAIRLALSGTLAEPEVDGEISLSKGRYESLEYGTLLQDIALAATVNKEKLILTRLDAQDGAKGKVTGKGELAIDPARDFPFHFGLRLTTFRAVHRDDVTGQLGGTIDVEGSLTAPKLLARLTTETVEINLATELPPNVTTLDVIEIRDGVVQEKPTTAEDGSAIDVALDVVVDMPQRVFVRGRGLDSEWSGRIQVEGSSTNPKVSGNIDLVRGQLSLVGKVFKLDQGSVQLPASANSDPSLDVTAVHKGRDLQVTARMRGPITKPELELTSSPEVPRDEIISRVLFNKSASQLTPGEAAQLALAVRDLTGKGGGADILGFARRTMGVDVLRVNTDAEGAAAVEAGRYLTDDVYLGVKQGADPESSSAGVEVELTPNVTIESEVTRSGASKSGVRFQLDY
jgi:translocation and assembly module TamB